ncbi:MAG: hypothetical protein HGA19_13765, partial [Oscillochloris sp.]|nr:hypothetical protein [Oscillochloris sp.]
MGKKKAREMEFRPVGGMAIVSGWPVYETLLSQDWDKEGALVSILVARRSPRSGKVAAASFLLDLACLGLKGTQVMLFKDAAEYSMSLRAHITDMMPMASADINLAAKIIFTGIQYAGGLGFKPDAVFAQSRYLIEVTKPWSCLIPVPTGGKDGKPLFINGPNDDVDR